MTGTQHQLADEPRNTLLSNAGVERDGWVLAALLPLLAPARP